jgi:hypothetical protein
MSGVCFRRWGVDGDETPRISTSHTGTAILNLPVPLGFQPGTFGGPFLAPVPTVQPMSARCKHRPFASAMSRVSAEDRRRPLLSATGHPARKNVIQVTQRRAAGPDLRCPPPVCRGVGDWQLGLSYLARILDRVGRAKRRAKRVQPVGRRRQEAPTQPPGQAQAASRMPAAQLLEQIERTRIAQRRAEAALAKLIDQAVGLGIGWPEIAARLGVTRQAARQHYQRRHRGSVTAQDRRS